MHWLARRVRDNYVEPVPCPDCPEGKAIVRERYSRLFQRAELPERYRNARLDEFADQKWLNGVMDVVDSGRGLWIFGDTRGNGKSHLAAACLNRRLGAGSAGLFLVVPALLEQMRKSYGGKGPSAEAVLEAASTVPVLVLDDLGRGNDTPWAREKLYLLVNERYNHLRQTIVTSNVGPEAIKGIVGDAVTSRLTEMCEYLEFEGADRRLSTRDID